MGASVGRYEMTFKLLGHDQASKVLQKVDGNFKKTAQQADKTGSKFQKAGKDMGGLTSAVGKFIPGGDGVIRALGGMGSGAGGAGLAFGALAGGVMAAVAALMAFRGQAEEAAALSFRLSRLGDSFGETTIEIQKLRREAQGVFSTAELVNFLTLQKELGIDLGLTGEQLQKLDARFTAIGKTAADGFKAISEEIKKGGGEQLVSLGLVDDLNGAFKEQEKILGRSLTLQERQAVALKETKKGIENIDLGGSAAGITAFERISASLSDIAISVGELFGPVFEAFAPFLEGVQRFVETVIPLIASNLRIVLAPLRLLGEVMRGVLDTVASGLVPLFRTLANVISVKIGSGMSVVRSGFVALAGITEEIAQKLLKWVGGLGGIVDTVVNFIASDPMGLLNEQEKKRLEIAKKNQEIADQQARDLEWQAETLEKQKTTMADLSKFWDKTSGDIEKSSMSLVRSEAGLLTMKETSGSITQEEKNRLEELRNILKVEQATGKIRVQMAKNTETLNKLEAQRAKLLADPAGVDVTEIQKIGVAISKMMDEQIKLQEIAYLASEEAVREPRKPGQKPQAKAKKDFDLNATLNAIRTEAQETAKSNAIKRIQIELRSVELALISEKDEQERIALTLKQETLKAEMAEIENKRLLGQHIRDLADARALSAQNAIEEAAATEQAARATRELNSALSTLGAMSGQFAGNELATMGTAMAGLASLASKLEEGQIGVSEAISGSGGVVAAAAGEFIESKRAIAAIMAVFETAAAFAAFPNVAAMAAHGTAAALYGSIAAGAGSVRSAGGEASPALQSVSEDIDRERDRGDRQIVINISGVVTDAQGIGSQIKTALGSMEGTGI